MLLDRSSFPIFVLHEDHDKSCENVNSVQVDANAFIDRIIDRLQLGAVDDFLDIIKHESTEQ
jgi:hypothetical protein